MPKRPALTVGWNAHRADARRRAAQAQPAKNTPRGAMAAPFKQAAA